MSGWESFFVAEVGAAAALGGLLFVAISLNLARILSVGGLPDRALQALLLLLAVLIVASLMLFPDQPTTAIGLEILGVSAATFGLGTLLALRARHAADVAYRGMFFRNLVVFEIAVAPGLIGG